MLSVNVSIRDSQTEPEPVRPFNGSKVWNCNQIWEWLIPVPEFLTVELPKLVSIWNREFYFYFSEKWSLGELVEPAGFKLEPVVSTAIFLLFFTTLSSPINTSHYPHFTQQALISISFFPLLSKLSYSLSFLVSVFFWVGGCGDWESNTGLSLLKRWGIPTEVQCQWSFISSFYIFFLVSTLHS